MILENIYGENDSENDDPDYDVANDSDNSNDDSNISMISQRSNLNEKSATTNSSLDTSKHNYEGIETCDINFIMFKSELKGANKKYFSMYYKKLQSKFARHLETVHKNETEVKKFILLPRGKYNNLNVILNHILYYRYFKLLNFYYNFS